MLIDSGADLEARNDYGCTPLCHAAMHGEVYFLKDLLTFGTDVNAVDYEGHSALHLLILHVFRTQHTYGIENRFLEAIEFLLGRGANPLLVDLSRRTARGILMAEAQEKFASRGFPTGE
jgi:ankyrin repeat protein